MFQLFTDDTIAGKEMQILRKLPDDIVEYKIFKYGAISGLTYGKYSLKGCLVNMDGKKLFNQIEVLNDGNEIFSDFGDSGAVVYISVTENKKTGKGYLRFRNFNRRQC